MQILMLLKAVAGLATAVFDWLREQRRAALIEKVHEATLLEETTDAIDQAHQARLDADLVARREPDSLRADDGYRRD